MASCLPRWFADNVVPASEIPAVSNYDRGHRMYGINKWVDFFGPRQLLTHAAFVEEFRRLVPEIRAALDRVLADAVLTELALMQGKALNYNARQNSWDVGRQKTRSVFEKHNFAFKWTFVEFPGPGKLLPWCLSQLVDAYDEIARLLEETGQAPLSGETLPRTVRVTCGNAADVRTVLTDPCNTSAWTRPTTLTSCTPSCPTSSTPGSGQHSEGLPRSVPGRKHRRRR